MVRWNEQKVECDQCGAKLSIMDRALDGDKKPLPLPWRQVTPLGWAGSFEVCSDRCERLLRARYERPETGSEPPPPHEDAPEGAFSERPTRPDIPSSIPPRTVEGSNEQEPDQDHDEPGPFSPGHVRSAVHPKSLPPEDDDGDDGGPPDDVA